MALPDSVPHPCSLQPHPSAQTHTNTQTQRRTQQQAAQQVTCRAGTRFAGSGGAPATSLPVNGVISGFYLESSRDVKPSDSMR
jgi:hypothetical protein